jgi:hypothetical protein
MKPYVIFFPLKGIHKGVLPGEQPEHTASVMQNVRPYYKGRLRGGQRPGLAKWSDTQIGGVEQPVVAVCSVSVVE